MLESCIKKHIFNNDINNFLIYFFSYCFYRVRGDVASVGLRDLLKKNIDEIMEIVIFKTED